MSKIYTVEDLTEWVRKRYGPEVPQCPIELFSAWQKSGYIRKLRPICYAGVWISTSVASHLGGRKKFKSGIQKTQKGYRVRVTKGGKQVHVGTKKTLEEAMEIVKKHRDCSY